MLIMLCKGLRPTNSFGHIEARCHLKSKPKDWRSQGSNPGPLVYKDISFTRMSWGPLNTPINCAIIDYIVKIPTNIDPYPIDLDTFR